MAPRVCLPGELFLDAILMDPGRQLERTSGPGDTDWGRRVGPDDAARHRAKHRAPFVALRWVLNPALGVPVTPFTVWRRPSSRREELDTILGFRESSPGTYEWDGLTEMVRIEVTLADDATVTGLHRADLDPVQTVSGSAGDTVVLDAGPMLGIRTDRIGAISTAYGLSATRMANGDGWDAFEVVGLPFTDQQLSTAGYYDGADQGLVGSPTDPFEAAVERIARWGPVLGWDTLGGLDPWAPPDSKGLVEEMQGDLLADLAGVLGDHQPPGVADQLSAQVVHTLDRLQQVVGVRGRDLNGAGLPDRSEITVRPLQALITAVATDTWASLALGFGTGDAYDPQRRGGFDYLVTARWHGTLQQAVPVPWPFPGQGAPPPLIVEREVERELAAVVLAPSPRPAPDAPTPVTAGVGHEEGAPVVDDAYRTSVVLQTARPPALPREPRAAGYALARYDKPGDGAYQLREHPVAGGWIPIGSAIPVLEPGTPPDPATPPNTVTLRNSGVPRPVTGPPSSFEYYAAAADLFGQWSPWSMAWLSLPAAGVQAPVVAAVRARAVPGAGDTDPCALTVSAEVVWDSRERSLRELTVGVDAYPPTPPPPALLDPPSDAPLGGAVTVGTATLTFSSDGTPDAPPAGVEVVQVLDDDTPVGPGNPPAEDERRYRITLLDVPVTYAGEPELAVAVHARAVETVRPGEPSAWTHAREAAIAPNPIPPPPMAPLPAIYPTWAALPDPAGLSYAPVRWTPTGAWAYRVFEANEAALLTACGRPGPNLTDGYAERMQALFDLHKVTANLPLLRKAYRKLGTEAIHPASDADGRLRYEALLPRGSGLIHCFVVVGVTPSNVLSAWPRPDADGRRGFEAYVIPRPQQPAQPQVRAALGPDGTPRVTVTVRGAIPPSTIRLYRADHAILARSTGTMSLVDTAVPGADWHTTVLADPGAPTSWSRLQYRAVAVTSDDLEHAGVAVPSAPSAPFALLNPPPDPPTLTLTANVEGTTPTVALVRVDTDALRDPTDVGDFSLSYTATRPGADPVRHSSSLFGLVDFPDPDALAASSEPAGWVAGTLLLRLVRPVGDDLGLTVDVVDPLGRSTHAVLRVAGVVPDPEPSGSYTALLSFPVYWMTIWTNMPLPPDPARQWTLEITELSGLLPPRFDTTYRFALSTVPTIASEAAMPDPWVDRSPSAIRRLEGTSDFVFWARARTMPRLEVRVVNAEGQSGRLWSGLERR